MIEISPKYSKISTETSPYRYLWPSIGRGCKDYQGIKTGGWKFSGAGCVSQQNYRCCPNLQREVSIELLQYVIYVMCSCCSHSVGVFNYWIMQYIIYNIRGQNVDRVIHSYTAHSLFVSSSPFRACFNPAPLKGLSSNSYILKSSGQWCLSWCRCSPFRCCGSSDRHRRMRFVKKEPRYFRESHSHTIRFVLGLD